MLNFFLKRGNSPIPLQSKWNYTVFVFYPSQGGQRNKNKQKRKSGRGEKPDFQARKFSEQPHTLGFLGRSYQT